MIVNVAETHKSLLDDLATMIMMDEDAGTSQAAENTRTNILRWREEGHPTITAAFDLMEEMTTKYLNDAMGIPNSGKHVIEPFYVRHRQFTYVHYHNHKGSMLTGIIYIDIPGGDIELHDPRSNANRRMGKVAKSGHFDPITLSPKTGDVVIFPSYVYHVGTPNMHPCPRLLMPFDVMP